jgi:hypothetical protein
MTNLKHLLNVTQNVPRHVPSFYVRIQIFLFDTLISTVWTFNFQILMNSQVIAHCRRVSRSEWTECTFIWFLSCMSSYVIPHIFPIVRVVFTRKADVSE